jgi:hypothetical protein
MNRDDTIDMFAAFALQGILAHSGGTYDDLNFKQVVALAANYAEALANLRIDNPPQDEV